MTIQEALGVARSEHPTFEMLEQVVDGTADDVTVEIVESHCEVCPSCAEELRDLREFTGDAAPARNIWMGLAAGVAIAVIGIGAFVMRKPAPATTTLHHVQTAATTSTSYGRADWDQEVRDALASGRAAYPLEDWPARDPQRGPSDQASAEMSPTNIVVDTATPLFKWRAKPGRYVVTVYFDSRLVAKSPTLHSPEWQVTPPLKRGREYSWQVEILRGGAIEQLPTPPDPPAQFRILDEVTSASLAEARSKFPNDRVLLGVLLAKAGMRAEAADALRGTRVSP